MVAMDLVDVLEPDAVKFLVTEVFADGPSCIAVAARVDMTTATQGGGFGDDLDYIIERVADGWGYSWTGSGWRCDGPHPFSD